MAATGQQQRAAATAAATPDTTTAGDPPLTAIPLALFVLSSWRAEHYCSRGLLTFRKEGASGLERGIPLGWVGEEGGDDKLTRP